MSKRIAAFCSDLISTSGPLPPIELAARAVAAGVTTSRDPERLVRTTLSRTDGFLRLPDDRYDAARRLLDGVVLTHRLLAPTAYQQVLYAGPELTPFSQLLAERPMPLAGGGEIRRSAVGIDGWAGPPGWLPDVNAGTLLGVRLHAGTLTVAPVTDDEDVLEARAGRVRSVAARHLGALGLDDVAANGFALRRELTGIVLRALAECPDLLAAAVPPLDETLRLPQPSWREVWTGGRDDGLGPYDEPPPPYSRDLRPYDTAPPDALDLLRLDDDDDDGYEDYDQDRPSSEDDDLDSASCEELEHLYAGSPAGVVRLSGTRPAGSAGSSEPHTDRRPR